MTHQSYMVQIVILLCFVCVSCLCKQKHKISGSGKARAKFDKYENKRYNIAFIVFLCFVCVAGIICFISSLLFDYLKILLDRIASILVLSH